MTDNIKWGVTYGLIFAAFYSLIVIAQFAFAGPRIVEDRGMNIWTALAVYTIGGIIGGAIVGLLKPITRWRIGASAVGIVAALPVCFAFVVAVDGHPYHWEARNVFGALFTAVFLGGYAGYRSWVRSD